MRRFKANYSIRQSIFYPSVLIVLISILVVSMILFFSFQRTTSEIVEDSSKEINKQIILNFENYIDSVIDTANYIQEKTLEYSLRYNQVGLDDVYTQAAEVQPDIESIVLMDRAGNVIVKSNTKEISQQDLTQKEWFKDALTDESIYHFSSPHPQDIFRISSTEVITVTKVVTYYFNDREYRGILVVDINTSSIITLTETTNLGTNGHIVILNDDDSLIYSNNNDCITDDCLSLQISRDIIFGGRSVEIGETDFYANVNTLRNTRWRMATFINIDILSSTRSNTLFIMGLITIVTFFITMGVSSIVSRRISSPISRLKNHMEKLEHGDFYKKIEVDGQQEVVSLSHSFNSMIEEIQILMDRVITEQKSKRKTEFQALQNQINPHFLYNTLDSIVYLSENKMNDKVIKMVVALSRFFRISISRGKNIIYLKEELEHARNYLLIQQIRYNEKFHFTFEVDDNVLDYKVVKLSLQPLIENAIVHGISTEYDGGMITIRAFQDAQNLVIEVEDDGYGMTDEQIEDIYNRIKYESENKSVGLRNVYQRLRLYYGDNAKFIVESELDIRTTIRLIIPIEGAL
jgi:two-component system sensor histidine kinase YesM